MRDDVRRTLTPAAAAAAAWWLMGIAGALLSVAAGSEMAVERRAAGRQVSPRQSTASTADLLWPTAVAGQFSL